MGKVQGYPKKVIKECGQPPVIANMAAVADQFKLDKLAIARQSTDVQASASAQGSQAGIPAAQGSGDAHVRVESEREADGIIRDAAVELLEETTGSNSDAMKQSMQAWQACYAMVLGVSPESMGIEASPTSEKDYQGVAAPVSEVVLPNSTPDELKPITRMTSEEYEARVTELETWMNEGVFYEGTRYEYNASSYVIDVSPEELDSQRTLYFYRMYLPLPQAPGYQAHIESSPEWMFFERIKKNPNNVHPVDLTSYYFFLAASRQISPEQYDSTIASYGIDLVPNN